MGNIRCKRSHVVIFSSYTNLNRQFSIIFFNHHLPWPEQIKLQTSPKPSLINIREQCCHLGLAWQLFFQLNHVLLDLFSLTLQSLQTHSFSQFFLIVLAQGLLFSDLGFKFDFILIDLGKPKNNSHRDGNKKTQQNLWSYWPQRGVFGVQIPKLSRNVLPQGREINIFF